MQRISLERLTLYLIKIRRHMPFIVEQERIKSAC